jgi:hypothetical protein
LFAMKYYKLISACAVLTASIGFAAPAMALPTTYEITTYVGSGGPITGDFGTVTLNQVGSNVTVDWTPKSCCGLVPTGKVPDVLDFYLSGIPSITVTGLTAGFNLDSASASSYGNGATGAFNFAIDCPSGGVCGTGGNAPYTGSLDFTVQNVTIADFAPNALGFHFAVDICDGINPLGGCSGGSPGITGAAVDVPTTRTVPEPITLSLFGAGLAGAAAMRRRRKKA